MKEIIYTTRRLIDSVEINGDIVAYKEEVFIDEQLVRANEGITLKQILDKVSGPEAITTPSTKLRGDDEGHYFLYKTGVRELVRRYPYGWDELHNGIDELFIEKPFSYIKEHGLDGAEFLCYSDYDANLYDEAKVIQPRAMHFTYINGWMDNRNYDLNEVVQILEQREDIIWHDGRRKWEKYGEGDSKIQKIPYYNAEEGRTHCLDFLWTPSEEDWAKARDDVLNLHRRYDAVSKKVFGLTKKAED